MRSVGIVLVFLAGCGAGHDDSLGPQPDGSDIDADADGDSGRDPCDIDGDAHPAEACGGDDCDDENATAHPGAPPATWRDGPSVRSDVCLSIAFDADGVLHLLYWADGLRHATNVGDVWRDDLIDPHRDGSHPTLVIDAAGGLHAAYQVLFGEDTDLRYAADLGSGWLVETADAEGLRGDRVSLAIDDDAAAHVSHGGHDVPGEGTTHYSTNASGAWISEDVGPRGEHDATSIALDAAGTPYVAHASVDEAERVGAWKSTTADADGLHAAIAIDAEDVVHLAYFVDGGDDDAIGRGLVHATRVASVWRREVVDPDGVHSGHPPSMRLDADGAVRVAYLGRDGGEVRIASNAGGAWRITTVAAADEGTAFDCPSLALAPNGGAAVAWAGVGEVSTSTVPDADLDCDGVAD